MEQVKAEPVAWECFCDRSYYDMWCVRQVGQRTFGEGFHLVNGGEAQALCDMLNATPQPAAVDGLVDNKVVQRAVMASVKLGAWMSAARDALTLLTMAVDAPDEIAALRQAIAQIERKPEDGNG